MKKIIFVISCFAALQLAGCTSNFISQDNKSQQNTAASGSTAIGGKLETSMDESDNTNLSKALDKGLGKSTEWVNAKTNIKYIVVPISKLTINGNPFCRRYKITSIANGNEKSMHGTACVSPVDSSWRVASN